MKPKIRVHGKSQSRTALGIINAYLKLNPDATPSEVQQAFPKSLNRRCPAANLIIPVSETKENDKSFFEHEYEQVVFKNGERYAFVEVWTKDDFLNICEHAKQYGIEAAKEGTKPFERGSFDLELIEEEKIMVTNVAENKEDDTKVGTSPLAFANVGDTNVGASLAVAQEKAANVNVEPTPAITPNDDKENDKKKCKCKWWWWILLLILLLLLLIFFCKKCCSGNICESSNNNDIENVTDDKDLTDLIDKVSDDLDASIDNLITDNGNSISVKLPDGNVLNIDKNSQEYKLFSFLNSPDVKVDTDRTKGWINMDKVKFQSGKSTLASGSDNQLKSIAQIMQIFPNSHLKIGGYTDNIGGDATNMRISGERAKVTAERLVSLGVAANRITHEGYGSKHPVCPANDTEDCRAANRRIDVRVTQK